MGWVLEAFPVSTGSACEVSAVMCAHGQALSWLALFNIHTCVCVYLHDVALLFKLALIGCVSRGPEWGAIFTPWAGHNLPFQLLMFLLGWDLDQDWWWPQLVWPTMGVRLPLLPALPVLSAAQCLPPCPAEIQLQGHPFVNTLLSDSARVHHLQLGWIHLGSRLPHCLPCARCLYAPHFSCCSPPALLAAAAGFSGWPCLAWPVGQQRSP